ncbi:MAG TPA: hypothetical protein VGF99_14955 [Myxococcota bacterium]
MSIDRLLRACLVTSSFMACAPEPTPEPVPPFDDTPAPLPANLPTAAELATSPRADARAEVAALVVDADRWLASDATYARVVADFDAIDDALPALGYGFAAPDLEDASGVSLAFPYAPDDEAVQAATARARAEAVRIAEALGGRETTGDNEFAAAWPARLQPVFIRATFGAIDGVRFASAGIRENNNGGHQVLSEQFDVDGRNVWLMLTHGGDCPEGCTELQASRVRVEPVDGALVVELLGQYDSNASAPCPDWLAVRPGICERYGPQGG